MVEIMKIMLLVDLHSDIKRLKKLRKKSKEVDVVIDAGDISVFGNGLIEMLRVYDSFDAPVLVVPGNHETEKELKDGIKYFENVKYIHKQILEKGGVVFIGYGGGGFSLVDKEFEKWVKKIANKIKNKKIVLVLHGPPYNTECDLIYGEHVGNKSYLNFIKKYQPELVVCGHLHENEGKKCKIGKTLVINPGDKGIIVEV